MITEQLLEDLRTYRLTIIETESGYRLGDQETKEWYENMSMHYIIALVEQWNDFRNK